MSSTLSPSQSAALFDILTHYDTYAEIRNFRDPGSLKNYGPPFTFEPNKPSTSPALQTLVTRFLLTLPGLNNLPDDFWKVQCQDLIENFEQSNLSESYDKGVIGSRKTLATAISALIEYPLRGTTGGFAGVDTSNRQYDTTKAEDLVRAFRDFMNECIYGNVLEELVEKLAKTDNLDDHDPLIKAVHEFLLVNLASFMHYTLVLSPKGQYLLKLLDGVNKLIPYLMIRQTLKVGNVATMISAMVKLVLAKMSVTSFTNWVGLTASQDNALNLLQYIISSVLHWDMRDLESRATKIEKDKSDLDKDDLRILKDYASKSQEDQDLIRKHSQKESISIVTSILQTSESNTSPSNLSEPHHTLLLEYLSITLSIRDRKEIIRVLCHSTPDHLTLSIRQLVDAYEPVIRHMHNAINLSGTIGDAEVFLRDLIKVGKIQVDKTGTSSVPTVGDFIMLLRKHQYSSHTFIHQCCKNGPEVTSWYLNWAKTAASHFRRKSPSLSTNSESQPNDTSQPISTHSAAGSLTPSLNALFTALPPETQSRIIPVLNAETNLITSMHASSLSRLSAVLRSPPSKNPTIAKILSTSLSLSSSRSGSRSTSRAPSPAPAAAAASTDRANADESFKDPTLPTPKVSDADASPGPGAYLARWQDLLDNTPITPSTVEGKVQAASSAEVVRKSAEDVDGDAMVEFGEDVAKGKTIAVDIDEKQQEGMRNGKPDVKIVVEALGEKFRDLLAEKGCDW